MRLLAHISAAVIVLAISYWLVAYGYPHFLAQYHSRAIAQAMMFGGIAATMAVMLWAVKKLP